MFLEEVITVKEAAILYKKDISTIKRNIYRNFKEGIDYRYSGATLLINKASLDNFYKNISNNFK